MFLDMTMIGKVLPGLSVTQRGVPLSSSHVRSCISTYIHE